MFTHARPCVFLGRVLDGIPQTDNRIRLSALLPLNDVKLDIVALFQRFVSVKLNGGVVNENIWPVFATNESVALRVVEPLDLPFVLSHRICLSVFQ